MTDDTALIPLESSAQPMSFHRKLDQHPAAVYLASLTSPNSRRTMRAALDTIAALLTDGQQDSATLPWGALRFQHTAAIQAALAERYKPATANKLLAALRGVLKAAYKLGYMTSDEYARATDIPRVKGETLPAGRDLAIGEIRALAEACKADTTPLGARDAAILGILYTCGLRRAELVALDLADFERETGKLTVRSGKGRKARTVYVTDGALRALHGWLTVRGAEAGPLFYRILKGGHLTNKRLTTQAIYTILKERAAQAGVKAFSPHDFRRTFVGDLLENGADIATVAKLAGHASVTTTARYDRRDEATKKKAAGLLHFPF
ncbi:MAG: tyrosine-type recombinase/integrase [Anaerolineae bacterium]|nr:tyrosine-type recombinase/integrase [Anaerolineae bacterium]